MRKRIIYYLEEGVLGKLSGQGTYPDAPNALERFWEIKKAGGSPRCFYTTGYNSFTVLDENHPDDARRAISMGERAKPFPI